MTPYTPEQFHQDLLTFIAEDEAFLESLVETSSISPQDLQDMLTSSDALVFLMDHLLNGDEALLRFCNRFSQSAEKIWQIYKKISENRPAVG